MNTNADIPISLFPVLLVTRPRTESCSPSSLRCGGVTLPRARATYPRATYPRATYPRAVPFAAVESCEPLATPSQARRRVAADTRENIIISQQLTHLDLPGSLKSVVTNIARPRRETREKRATKRGGELFISLRLSQQSGHRLLNARLETRRTCGSL